MFHVFSFCKKKKNVLSNVKFIVANSASSDLGRHRL
jgi:hypothetical protein